MSKELESIKYLNDTCINFLDRTKELYCTVTFTRKRAEILRDDIAEVNKSLQRLESIDNANPSEALKCLEHIKKYYIPEPCSAKTYDCLETIKQALLKAQFLEEEYNNLMEDKDNLESELFKQQEPKQYLKWEDLEFDNNASVKKHLKVKLGDNIYKAYYHYCFILNSELFCIENDKENLNIYITNKQFFNDLHLEMVEE